MHWAWLAQRKKLASAVLHEVVPQDPLQRLSSQQKTSYDDGITCDDMHILFNKQFDSRFNLNSFDSKAIVKFDNFLRGNMNLET
jgi:hypothetical protein